MINTFLQIGKTLREGSDDVAFLPFVEIGKAEEIKDAKGKVKQEKPFVQIYDVFIDGDNWEMKKSEESYNENHQPVFIKGNRDDRFYIAGDLNGNYFGKDIKIQEYFENIKTELNKVDLSSFIKKYRLSLGNVLQDIEKQVKEFNEVNVKTKIFIQFRFHENGTVFYWGNLKQYIEEIGDFMINLKYVKNHEGKLLLEKGPVSFFSVHNLNNLQNLERDNSYKVISLKDGNKFTIDKLKNLLVADKYLKNTTKYFGKALVQILPSGKYSLDSLKTFLGIESLWDKTSEKFDNIVDVNDELSNKSYNSFEIFEREERITKFDILFLNRGANTIDITLYLSSLSFTEIDTVKKRFNKARDKTNEYLLLNIEKRVNSDKVSSILHSELDNVTPFRATEKLIKGFSKNDGKLEKHHKEILYKIFRHSYFDDPILLISFNQKIEYGLRNNDDFKLNYLILLINFIYINHILINNQYLSMKETQSYKVGNLLGKLARNIDSEINSFSKQYAGNISRRVATKEDFTKLLNFINEKLVIHEKLYTNVRETTTELINSLNSFDEQYKKDYVIAGFFESYLMPFAKKED